jgi:hypothetical protein
MRYVYPSKATVKTLEVHCRACDETFEYILEPNQTLYGASYTIGCRHETTSRNPECMFNAAKHIELVCVK